MKDATYDFSGYATRVDIRCADGRVIKKGAFKDMDGRRVPLVYNHEHTTTSALLGHADLEYRDGDIYAYCSCNNTQAGQDAKEGVLHGDLTNFSIYANQVKQNGADVVHGNIREVSLVLAGANPGAYIDTILMHSDDNEEEAVMRFIDEPIEIISHAEEKKDEAPEEKKEEAKMADEKERTVEDVLNSMNEEQLQVTMGLVAEALEKGAKSKDSDEGEDNDMKQNAFDNENVIEHSDKDVYLSQDEITSYFKEAKTNGSMKQTFLAHGIDQIDYLFPDYKNLDTPPQFIKRDTDWVSGVMSAVRKTPFSRIRSTFANITADEARARGYIKGHQKTTEVFPLLKRTTDPQTVYKMQKFDRDDIIDITDFDVVNWVKGEMRLMLDEEIARAILIGDGREPGTEYAISHDHIRPIWTDADLYTVKVEIGLDPNVTLAEKAKATIQAIIRARKNYKGSGNPVFYTTEDVLTEMLLIEDLNQRIIYDSVDKLATALRVSKIVTVPVMEGLTRTKQNGDTLYLQGIIVNLTDYNVGADKGGAVNLFDDFDIDFNQYKYLIETRCSGALVKPYSAMAIEVNFQ